MDIIRLKSLKLDEIKFDDNNNLITKGDIRKQIICIRPGHKSGLPIINCEKKNNKIISHNYGHSGVGYSILFAAVDESIQNYQKCLLDHSGIIDYGKEITIIGLGCIGLVTALTLYYKGFNNINVIGESVKGTPSLGAGGLFEFSLTTIYKPEQIEYMNKLFKSTFLEYKNIIESKHRFISRGVKMVDYYTDFYQENAGLSYLASLGLIPQPKVVKVKCSDNGPELEVTHFKTFHINTNVFMMNLLYQIKKLLIPITFKKISSFTDITSESIFNCSGLGSYYLNNDKDCYPICGHGFLLSNNSIGNHDYILRLANVLENSEAKGSLYFMPKISGFIGGSYMPNYTGDDKEINKDVIRKLIDRSKYIFKGIKPKF